MAQRVAGVSPGSEGVTEADINRTLRGSLGSGSNMVRPRMRDAVWQEIRRLETDPAVVQLNRLRTWLRREELRMARGAGKGGV